MAHELHTEITIDADPPTVWAILTDLAAYPKWNPFITSARGTLAVGQQLVNRLQPPGGKPLTFKPTVTRVEHEQAIEWLGRLGLPGVFDGRHRFELTPHGNGTQLIHAEHFSGILVPLLKRRIEASTRAGFEAMNAALKVRAESLGPPAER